MRLYRANNVINIIGGIICLLLIVSIFVFREEKVVLGVLFRGVFSLLILFNALYLLFTDQHYFKAKNVEKIHRKIAGILLLIVGLITFITALMGYGINGYPLLDWKTILKLD